MSDQLSLFLLIEAAERTGLTVDALRKRIRRGKLEMVKGNDGLVRVRLTSAEMDALRLTDGQTGQPLASQPDERDRTISALEAESATLRDGLDRERERADRAEAAAVVPELRERVGRAEGEAVALHGQILAERDRAAKQVREAEAARDAAQERDGGVDGWRAAGARYAGAAVPAGAVAAEVRHFVRHLHQ